MVLPNRMSLRPGLVWLALNLALIIQCLLRNNIYIYTFFQSYMPIMMFCVPRWYAYPRLKSTAIEDRGQSFRRDCAPSVISTHKWTKGPLITTREVAQIINQILNMYSCRVR
jgi:hypothetical protein